MTRRTSRPEPKQRMRRTRRRRMTTMRAAARPGPAHDTDEQDPDLSFAEVAKVVANLDLGPDPAKSKNRKKKEAPQPAPQAPPVQQFVKPGPPIPQRILDDLDMCCVKDFSYSFSRKTLANGRSPPVICSSCQKSGHLHEDCPDHRLPELKPLPDMTRSYTKILNDVCQDVMKICTPDPEEEACREKVLHELESFIRQKYKDARLALYGSSCNGFGLIHSDLDICLTFEHSKDGKDFCHKEKILDLAKELNGDKNLKKITAITSAKVPIVKFYHKPTQLEGDISFYNTLAQHNTRLLKVYSQIDERVRILGYTFKHFAKTCAIGDASRGSLSSYAYILLTLYYLQQCKPPVIPVLQELYPEGEQKPELIVEGWNAWFYDDIDRLQSVWSEFGRNNETVGELWLDPFDLDHNLGSGVTKSMSTYIMKTLIKGRSHFGTPVRRLPATYGTFLAYFFDARNLVEGSPPNDRGCRICGKIGHRMKQCPNRNKNGGKDKDATGGNGRAAGVPRNKFRPRQLQSLDTEEMDAEQQPNRENLNSQRLNQPQQSLGLNRRARGGMLPPRAPAEGHPSLCPEAPHGGIAPPGVAQAQLQRTLQNMATAGLQMGPSRCFVPHMGPPPAFMAAAPPPAAPHSPVPTAKHLLTLTCRRLGNSDIANGRHWVHHLGTPCHRPGHQACHLLRARRRCSALATSSDQGGPTTSRHHHTLRPCPCHHHRSSHFSWDTSSPHRSQDVESVPSQD
ncbi:hypothetical protein MRX96_045827 [Rhipicephalus microplus]